MLAPPCRARRGHTACSATPQRHTWPQAGPQHPPVAPSVAARAFLPGAPFARLLGSQSPRLTHLLSSASIPGGPAPLPYPLQARLTTVCGSQHNGRRVSRHCPWRQDRKRGGCAGQWCLSRVSSWRGYPSSPLMGGNAASSLEKPPCAGSGKGSPPVSLPYGEHHEQVLCVRRMAFRPEV